MSGAVAKSFLVLETLATAAGPMRLSALAEELDLQKSTVHRVLAELVHLRYVTQDDTTGLYRPTLRTWEFGSAIVSRLPIRQTASTTLHELRRETGETVSLVVRAGDDALYLDKIISPRPERFTTRVGSRVPLTSSVGGLVILAGAHDGADVVRRAADRTDLSTPIDVEAIERSLASIRRRGHAVSSTKQPVVGIAAAVLDRDQTPVAALVVSAPSHRMNRDRRMRAIDLVVTAAARLGESLGGSVNTGRLD